MTRPINGGVEAHPSRWDATPMLDVGMGMSNCLELCYAAEVVFVIDVVDVTVFVCIVVSGVGVVIFVVVLVRLALLVVVVFMVCLAKFA